MSYKKKTSNEIPKARKRIAGIESIDPNLDLGNGLSCQAYMGKINAAETALDTYNTLLSKADEALSLFESVEHDLASVSERMLAGVGVHFGYDSVEYEKAGGTRKSDIKHPVHKTTAVKTA